MCPTCENCGRTGHCYQRSTGGYWGRPIDLCFNCLSVFDQEQILRARRTSQEGDK